MRSLFDHDFWHYATHFVIVLAASFFLTGYLLPRLRPADSAAFEQFARDTEAQYAGDTDGGVTPNETVDLFIAALDQGDVDRASRYFLPEDADKMRNELSLGKKSGGLVLLLAMLRLERRDVPLREDAHEIEFYSADDDEAQLVMDFVLNPASRRWKIRRF